MTHEEVQAWLDGCIEAWRTNDESSVRDLFSTDAVYSYRPWESDKHSARGIDDVVAAWLDHQDDLGAWNARYHPYAVEDERAVAVGWSRYDARDDQPERTYHNAFLLRFAHDGKCAEFSEFYMLED